MTNLAEMLRRTALAVPDKVAVTHKELSLTWSEVYARAAWLAGRVREAGVRRGEVVAIHAEHSIAQVVAIFGVAMAEAAFTVVSAMLKEDQIKHQVADAGVRVVVGTRRFLKPLAAFWDERRVCPIEVTLDGLPEGETAAHVPPADASRPLSACIPADVGCIIYTSGSTGKAKGVVVPHRTLLDGARIVSGYLKITAADTLLSLLPYNFDYGFNQLATVVYTGARIVIHNYAFPQDLVDTLVREKVTGMAAVPSLWPHLFNPRLIDERKKPAFEHLRYVTTAGGIHTMEILRRLTAFFPTTEILIMYGLTESFRSAYLPFSELFKRPGSIGTAVPEVELRVLDEQGRPCKPGQIGELYHRGAFVTYGYLNNPELTKEKFVPLATGGPGCVPEVAVRSGDLVSLDEDGFIYFHGRKDMQIKCNGYRVSPDEVEEAVVAFAGICRTAVFGRPHPELGQAVNLAYDTYTRRPVDEQALRLHLRSLLPSYAVPQQILFYEALPLTPNGKIDMPLLARDADARRPAHA
jgi:acyl-CoA synthetase (AMP-forming)/AMP-acid ligase II